MTAAILTPDRFDSAMSAILSAIPVLIEAAIDPVTLDEASLRDRATALNAASHSLVRVAQARSTLKVDLNEKVDIEFIFDEPQDDGELSDDPYNPVDDAHRPDSELGHQPTLAEAVREHQDRMAAWSRVPASSPPSGDRARVTLAEAARDLARAVEERFPAPPDDASDPIVGYDRALEIRTIDGRYDEHRSPFIRLSDISEPPSRSSFHDSDRSPVRSVRKNPSR